MGQVFWYRARFPMMLVGMLSLLAGMWAGLLRLGWNIPVPFGNLAAIHGPLMVSGFLGTVIGLERAVALGRPWGYGAPLFAAAGSVAIVASGSADAGAFLFIVSGAVQTAIYAVILRRQFAMFNLTMGLGALSWLIANILWFLGYPVSGFVLWWGGFVVLTIAGERLELSRFVEPPPSARAMFVVILGVLLAGLVLNTVAPAGGMRVTGAAMVAMAVWLSFHDIARRTVLLEGLPRFVAVCLLCGYFWLFAAGIFMVREAGWPAGFGYDAVLHSLFLGFAFNMIFGHAPIIFPAVLRVDVPYRSAFYAHCALLQFSIAVRVVSDLGGMDSLRMWGGLLNVLALVAFLGNTVLSVKRGLAKG